MEELVITPQRKLVVQKKIWKDQETLDIRTYITTEAYTGYTKKGINIPLGKAKDLAKAIEREAGSE